MSHKPGWKIKSERTQLECTKRDPHPTRYIVIAGVIRHRTSADDSYEPEISSYPTHTKDMIESALQSQFDIGWESMLKGYLSIRPITSATTVDHCNQLLEACNKILHGKQDDTQKKNRSQEIAEIQYYQSLPQVLKFENRHHYWDRPLETILDAIPATRQWWLRRVKKSTLAQTELGAQQTWLLHTSMWSTSIY
jgi:hypothetical protein